MKLRIFALFLLSVILAGLVYFAVVVSEVPPAITDSPETGSHKQTQSGQQQKTEPVTPETTSQEQTETSEKQTEVPKTTDEPVIPKTTEEKPLPTYKKVSFFAMGDNIMHDNVLRDASIKAGGTESDYSKGFDFTRMYSSVAPFISSADLAFINQESLVCADETKKPVGYPSFNSPRAIGDYLVKLGFDIVNTAHNHMLDMGVNGLTNSINYWESKAGITLIGGHKTKKDFDNIHIIEKNGIKIALLSYTTFVNYSYENSDSGIYIPYADKDVILAQVKQAKALADCVIVSMHWGEEDEYSENMSQRNLAQELVDAGVDVILGHHPHVLQTIKTKTRPDGGQTLICYSLGNSVSTMLYIKHMLGAFVTFDIVKDGNSPAEVTNITAHPIFNYYDKDYRNLKLYLLSELTQEVLDTHGSGIIYGGNPTIADLERRVNDHISSSLLP